MAFTTVYVATRQRRSPGPKATGHYYTTKTLTPMHAEIHRHHAQAETYENPQRVVTDFVKGMNLGCLPIVTGGRKLTREELGLTVEELRYG